MVSSARTRTMIPFRCTVFMVSRDVTRDARTAILFAVAISTAFFRACSKVKSILSRFRGSDAFVCLRLTSVVSYSDVTSVGKEIRVLLVLLFCVRDCVLCEIYGFRIGIGVGRFKIKGGYLLKLNPEIVLVHFIYVSPGGYFLAFLCRRSWIC